MAAIDYDELDAIKQLVEWERTQLVLRGQVDVSAILDTLDRTIRIAREQERHIEELEEEIEELQGESDWATSEREDAEEERDELQKRVEELEDENAELLRENDRLEDELHSDPEE